MNQDCSENMFRITLFLNIDKKKLFELLRPLRFKQDSEGLEWNMDGHFFRIVPFKFQGTGLFGYRIYFNSTIEGAAYLFDSSVGMMNPQITAVEYTIYDAKTKKEWVKELRDKHYKSQLEGIFKKGNVGLVVTDDFVNLQIRSTNRNLYLYESLREIELVKGDILPEPFDLFSFHEEQAEVLVG